MKIKFQLTTLSFLQFFVWGSWLVSLGGYLIVKLHFSGVQVGAIYGTMGIASLFMPALLGIVADRWMNAERVLGLCHIIGGGLLYVASLTTDPHQMFWIMLLNSMAYMPTIALSYSVSYSVLEKNRLDITTAFPPIRVWGTIGFILAMWWVDLMHWSLDPLQLQLAAVSGIFLGVYSFTLPQCKPSHSRENKSWVSALGLDAFVLFRERRMAIFLVFALFLGAALQITNTFGESFIHDFSGQYADSFAVLHPGLLMSLSQASETLFILTIPFFMKKYKIKGVILMSIFAWVLRFAFFAIGNPGGGIIWLILSMIVYGMAFDFFNVSGSMFMRSEARPEISASAQGVFMMMTNGMGAFLGGLFSGHVVDYFTHEGIRQWPQIWFTFAAYVLVLGLIFPFAFRERKRA
ncbi:MAG: nucleoside permease [Xanthomonadaceae bacterium]|nr:nucleoside permease [Xanthomonadaceae bacterium]